MNNMAISPHIFMYMLQIHNINRKIANSVNTNNIILNENQNENQNQNKNENENKNNILIPNNIEPDNNDNNRTQIHDNIIMNIDELIPKQFNTID